MESRVKGMGSGFIGRDAGQFRETRDFFVPKDLQRLAVRADTSVVPMQQKAQAVGSTALTGASARQEVRNPHQIWEGFEFPTDNWF